MLGVRTRRSSRTYAGMLSGLNAAVRQNAVAVWRDGIGIIPIQRRLFRLGEAHGDGTIVFSLNADIQRRVFRFKNTGDRAVRAYKEFF